MKIPLSIALTILLIFSQSMTCLAYQEEKSLPEKSEIESILKKVADWQIANFKYSENGSPGYLHDYGIDAWTNATLYAGMFEWAKISSDSNTYYNWLYEIGEKNKWQMPQNFKDNNKYSLYHADELCIGQFYLKMYGKYSKKKILRPVKKRIDWIINNPPNIDMNYRNKQSLTWSDALFMSPPVYVGLYQVTKNKEYLSFTNNQIRRAYNHLYDKDEKLFFRDDSYFDKEEANGTKVFWGRGNGWVVAGLVNILKELPQDSPDRSFYQDLLIDLTERLAGLQDKNGFWHASLLDPESYPSPETSATTLITYALAYCVNNELINKDIYYPVLTKAWRALTSAVNEEGKLGWVQPIGADPKKVTEDMTAVYGVGAFLLAGSEIYKLTSK